MKNENSELFITSEIKLFYDLHVPENFNGALPLLIAVHGYGAHKRYMMREAKAVAPENFVIASVQAPHQHFRQVDGGYRVGFGWLTDFKSDESVKLHHRFLNDLIQTLNSDGIIDKNRIFLYGFSQGCALNFRFALTFPRVLKGLIGVCGGIPGDIDTNQNYHAFAAETLYLYGNNDEFYSNEKFTENDNRLRELLPNYRSKQFTAAHIITDEMRDEIKKFLNSVCL